MSWNNKIVWSEGLFLRPQHFQQHDRYLEHFVESRCSRLRTYAWGFTDLKIDRDLLTVGKLAITSAAGVFPDGTPFNIPEDDEPPAPLDIGEDVRDSLAYLALPTRRPGTVEIDGGGGDGGLARYVIRDFEARDTTSVTEGAAVMQVGSLQLRLLLERDQRDEYACLGVAHIVESRADKNVTIDDSYMPSVLDCQTAQPLAAFISELQGLMHHRAEELSGRVTVSGTGGAAEIGSFLMLQSLNRYEPLVAHLGAVSGFHPEELYRLLTQMTGEMATFFAEGKRPKDLPRYRHHDLRASFAPVISILREYLQSELVERAVPIPLKEKRFGIRVAAIADRSLLESAEFVLAVSASMPTEQLQVRFPAQIKIGSVDKIRDLVNLQLPGIGLRPLPVAPRQIPFHSGYNYFELDRSGEYWQELKNVGSMAMHIGGDFPSLKLELWAIRGR